MSTTASTNSLPVANREPEQASRMGEVIASLPLSLRWADDPAGPDGTLVALGGGAGWPSRVAAALDEGALGVVVDDPGVADLEELEALRRRGASAPVVLDRPYLSNPAVVQLRERWVPGLPSALLLESDVFVGLGASRAATVLRQLSLVRVLDSRLAHVRSVLLTDHGHSVAGVLESGTAAVLGGIVSEADLPRARVRVLAPPRRLSLEVYEVSTARAAVAAITDEDGELILPTLYENAHRVSWRRVIERVRTGGCVSDLDEFTSDLEAFELVREAVR